jgi:hypothetical protein
MTTVNLGEDNIGLTSRTKWSDEYDGMWRCVPGSLNRGYGFVAMPMLMVVDSGLS